MRYDTIPELPKIGMTVKSTLDFPIIDYGIMRWTGTWMKQNNNGHELVGYKWQCKMCGLCFDNPYNHDHTPDVWDKNIVGYITETGAAMSVNDYQFLSTSQQEKCTPIFKNEPLKSTPINLPPSKYADLVLRKYQYIDGDNGLARNDARKCAILTIDLIIDALIGCHTAEEYGDYWQQVKQKISEL